jgi:hypothetical protein
LPGESTLIQREVSRLDTIRLKGALETASIGYIANVD